MWTKNGGRTLPAILNRIDQAIPENSVNKRVVVDDRSTDNTREIAKSFGWSVILNEGSGISDGANTALRSVESEYFASFEQDLFLSRDWWRKIPRYLEDSKNAAASGMRFASEPRGVRRLQQYVARKYRGEAQLSSWLRTRQNAAFTLGSTLDNTIYRTALVKKVGGFPKVKTNAGVDTTLAYRLRMAGFTWVVDYSVQSIHLRSGLGQELSHQYWYGTQTREIWRKVEKESGQNPPISQVGILTRFLMSPFTGLFIAFKTREPTIAYIHPLIRMYYLLGYLSSA